MKKITDEELLVKWASLIALMKPELQLGTAKVLENTQQACNNDFKKPYDIPNNIRPHFHYPDEKKYV